MIQEYSCSCGYSEDRMFRFGAKRPMTIPCKCGKRAKRKIHVPTVHFYGEGWVGRNASN